MLFRLSTFTKPPFWRINYITDIIESIVFIAEYSYIIHNYSYVFSDGVYYLAIFLSLNTFGPEDNLFNSSKVSSFFNSAITPQYSK